MGSDQKQSDIDRKSDRYIENGLENNNIKLNFVISVVCNGDGEIGSCSRGCRAQKGPSETCESSAILAEC
jgi:hypothetical protein